MAYDEVLAQRLREQLGDVPELSEKRMFGGLAFLERGNMVVGVHGDGLLARVGEEGTDGALARPGARLFDMGGRPMRGWVVVEGEALDDDALAEWIGDSRRFVATLPPK
jgi:hypothetical protein